MGPVGLLAQEGLYPIPGRPVDQWLMGAGMPLPLVPHLTDVGPVGQDFVEKAAVEPWHFSAVGHALGIDCLQQRVQRVVVIGVKLEDPPYLRPVFRVDLDQATPVNADVAIWQLSMSVSF